VSKIFCSLKYFLSTQAAERGVQVSLLATAIPVSQHQQTLRFPGTNETI
jgi:hypothetical protein